MSRRRRKKSWISWVIILVLLIGAGVVCYLVWENYFKDKPREEEKIEVIEGGNVVVKPDNEGSDEGTEVKKEEVVKYEGENPNNREELTGVVTYAGVSGENLMIRVNIDQYLNSGECMLLLAVAGNTTYSNVAPIVSSASTATCEGFNVPVSLLESGQYSITIEVESGGKKGVISGEVAI